MGLLDSINSLDSADGRLALGLLSAASARPVRTSTGAGLLEALNSVDAWKQQQEQRRLAEQDRQQRAAMQALQMEHIRSQIGETQAQAAQRTADAEKMRQALARQQQFTQALTQASAGTSPTQALQAGGGPTVANAANIGKRTPANWQALVAQFPEQADAIKKIAESVSWGAPEVARTIEGRDAQGRPVTLQFDKQGRQIGEGVQQWKAPEKVDTGGQVQFIDPVSLTKLSELAKTNSPDALLGANVTMRGQNMTDARSRDANAISSGNKLTEQETAMRKEFEGLPEVKSYKQAFPAYSGIVDAAKRSTPMADINMVYGLAKLYDPNSVVREGEYATVANSPTIPERVKGWAQYIGGGGKLTDQVKRQILAEAQGRIGSYEAEASKARDSFTGIVKRNGLNPDNVFASFGNLGAGGTSSPRVVDFGSLK